jgi:hypothetical protein
MEYKVYLEDNQIKKHLLFANITRVIIIGLGLIMIIIDLVK